MKTWLVVGLGLLLLAGFGTWTVAQKLIPASAQAAALDPEQERLATRFLDLLDAGGY